MNELAFQQELKIPLDAKKIVPQIVVKAGCVAVFVCFMFAPKTLFVFFMEYPGVFIFFKVLAVAMPLFLIMRIWLDIKLLADKTAGLILNSKGLSYNFGEYSSGIISWSEILKTDVYYGRSNYNFLLIELKRHHHYSKNAIHLNLLKNLVSDFNYKNNGFIKVSINASVQDVLKIDLEDLQKHIEVYRIKYLHL
ncbi:MAG: hypothetical protein HQL25_07810 [Candidatus Omnitrophica bacterium]|nr:hypothetical protein [Candidatus Omnitrophota bacterium]